MVIGVLVLVGGGAWFFFYRQASSGLISPLTDKKEEPEVKLLVWEDPAGFKFNYPQEVEINNHPEDEENYAHLELTATASPGSILIWVKDTKYQNIEDWAKDQGSEVQIFDSDLGGNPAKKVAFLNPQKLTTATIDVDALVLVELLSQDSWWTETYNQILSSFEFIPLSGEEISTPAKVSGSSGQTNEGGVIDEGEEIIE